MRVWQIATGETSRDYRELFFDHDLMILGPSNRGDARDGRYAVGEPNSADRQVDAFAKGPTAGDRVLVRLGRDVIGVGQIPTGSEGEYKFDPTFQSVYGWDLCHRRRVKWGTSIDIGSLATVYHKAKQKPSFTKVHESEIIRLVREIDSAHFSGPLKPLPSVDSSTYTEDELGVKLFRSGVSNKNIEDILAALRQASRLSSWYRSGKSGRFPTEHEVVSHIVLPLFLGLGWSHQQIAVEWKKVDMAFFKVTPTTEENCVMILEAKGLGRGLGKVLDQPRKYIEDLKLIGVRYIVVSDGESLLVYDRAEDGWNQHPVGYLTVSSLQREYLLPKGTKSIDTLVRLQPNAV